MRLFVNEQEDIGIRPENLLREIGDAEFSLKNPNTPLSSLAAFEQSIYTDDWREVMRLFLVRRTRSFIIQHYAETDPRDNRRFLTLPDGLRVYFPVRQPHSVRFRSDPEDTADQCARLFRADIVQIIDDLKLPRYGLGSHQKGTTTYLKDKLPPDLTGPERKILDDLSRAGRRLKGFCRTNLFKRLESSAHAFLAFGASAHPPQRSVYPRSGKTTCLCPSASRMPLCSTRASRTRATANLTWKRINPNCRRSRSGTSRITPRKLRVYTKCSPRTNPGAIAGCERTFSRKLCSPIFGRMPRLCTVSCKRQV